VHGNSGRQRVFPHGGGSAGGEENPGRPLHLSVLSPSRVRVNHPIRNRFCFSYSFHLSIPIWIYTLATTLRYHC
jgi:hypothetical protein